MSKRAEKKYSLLFINNDPKTHNAYKNILDRTYLPVKNSNKTHNELKTYSAIKSGSKDIKNSVNTLPFGFKEQRFQWQTNFKNKNSHSIELRGKLPSNTKINYDLTSEIKKVFSGFNAENQSKRNFYNIGISTKKKIAENLITKRVINPSIDQTFGHALGDFRSKIKYKGKNKSVGSLAELIEGSSISEKIKPKKKYLNSSFDNSVNLFSEDYHKYLPAHHKIKREVDKNIYNSGYAGVKTNFDALDVEKLDKASSNFINYVKRLE